MNSAQAVPAGPIFILIGDEIVNLANCYNVYLTNDNEIQFCVLQGDDFVVTFDVLDEAEQAYDQLTKRLVDSEILHVI